MFLNFISGYILFYESVEQCVNKPNTIMSHKSEKIPIEAPVKFIKPTISVLKQHPKINSIHISRLNDGNYQVTVLF